MTALPVAAAPKATPAPKAALAQPSPAQPSSVKISDPTLPPSALAGLSVLPNAADAQAALFAYLIKKSGLNANKIPPIPMHPHGVSALGSWFMNKLPDTRKGDDLYPVVYDDLRIARDLFGEADPERQRLGLTIAHLVAQRVRLNLGDYWLNARICEAFLLPHIGLANADGSLVVSRRNVLEDAYNAYAAANEIGHTAVILTFLLHHTDTDNTANWARTMLAQTYERQRDYRAAIATLQMTQPVDKRWMARLTREQTDAGAHPPASVMPLPLGAIPPPPGQGHPPSL